jgi:hypothetical protein
MSSKQVDDVVAGESAGTVGARDEARLLALLESDQTGGLTIAALREHGIKAPAQAVYALQLAGHPIERANCEDSDGHTTPGYRLKASSPPATAGRVNGSPER